MAKILIFKIKRSKNTEAFWEEFKVPYEPNLTVLKALQKINLNPVEFGSQNSIPIAIDNDCSNETCGRCSMIINGRARLACKTFVDRLEKPIKVEPLSKFALIEDLKVDRSELHHIKETLKMNYSITFDLLKDVKMKTLNSCILCGCCVDACPRCNEKTDFIGPAMVSQVYLYNLFSDLNDKNFRLNSLMGNGGISDCVGTRNCEKVCPKRIQISDFISMLNFEITIHAIKTFFRE